MIDAFFSGTAGLTAQQSSLDVISNNVANVNTNGYKSKEGDFENLLYISMLRPESRGYNTELSGAGAALSDTKTDMSEAAPVQTGDNANFFINGNGFFEVRAQNGANYYTRDGSFEAVRGADGGFYLGTSRGMFVMDAAGNPIRLGANGVPQGRPGVYDFRNSQGLLSAGDNLFEATNISGAAGVTTVRPEAGFVEASNVDLGGQMTDMIMSQRTFQLSSNVVQTANQIQEMINSIGQG